MELACGVVVRLTKLTESSLIIHWLTDSHGLLKTVAKGIRGPKNQYRGSVDLFVTAELGWAVSRGGDLHNLRDLAVGNLRAGLRKSYGKVLLAGYFCQLLDRMVEPGQPVPELFGLLTRALDFLEKGEGSRKVMRHFEREAARLSGLSAGGKEVTEVLRAAAGGFPASRGRCFQYFSE